MPPADEYYGGGQTIRGLYLAHQGDYANARKSYEAALSLKTQTRLRMFTNVHYGSFLENLGQSTEALARYKEAEPTEKYADSRDFMIRPVLLNLEVGNRKEALRILHLVRSLPRPYAEGNPCDLLADEAARGKAEAYWDGSAKWWPAWQNLEKAMGVPVLSATTGIFRGDDGPPWDLEFRQAVQAGDGPAYLLLLRRLAHHARWRPESAREFWFEASGNFRELMPNFSDDMCKFLLIMLDNFVSDEPEALRTAAEVRASCYLRLGMNDKAIDFIRQFLSRGTAADEVTENMIRFQATAALALGGRDGLMAASGPLAALLNAPKQLMSRALDVSELCKVYAALGDKKAERALLERELAREDTQRDEYMAAMLKRRYNELLHSSAASAQFSETVRQWLARYQPPWFGYAKPKGLPDPLVPNPAAAVMQWPKDSILTRKRPMAETIKLEALVAMDGSQPDSLKVEAFGYAFKGLLSLCATTAEMESLASSVADDESFPPAVRGFAWFYTFSQLASHGHGAEAQRFYAAPAAKFFTPPMQDQARLYLSQAKTDRSSPEAIKKECDRLAAQPPGASQVSLLEPYLLDLVALGEWDRATQVAGIIGASPYSDGANVSAQAVQLYYLDEIKKARAHEAMNRRLREAFLARYPDTPLEPPPVAAAQRDPDQPSLLSEGDRMKVQLYQMLRRHPFANTSRDWGNLMSSMTRLPGGAAFLHEVAQLEFATAGSDRWRAGLVRQIAGIMDFDDSAERDWLTQLVVPYRAKAAPPLAEELRVMDAKMAVRAGQAVDLNGVIATLTVPETKRDLQQGALKFYLNTGNLDALKVTVQGIAPEKLVQGAMLQAAMPALEALGMQDRVAIARSAADHQFYEEIVRSWSGREASLTRSIATLGEILGHRPLPPEWLATMEKTPDTEGQLSIRIQEARQKEDWETAARLSAQAAALPSDENDYLWYEAEALSHAGRKEEAMKPLQAYLSRAIMDYHYRDASRLLQLIRAGTETAANGDSPAGALPPPGSSH